MTNFPLAAATPLRAQIAWGPLQWYASGLVAAVAALGFGLGHAGMSPEAPAWILVIAGVVALVAEKQSVRISPTVQTSVSVLPILFAAVVYGPITAMAVAAFALLADFGRPHTRWIIWTSSRVLSAGLAGVAAVALLSHSNSFGRFLIAVGAAAAVEATTNLALTVMTATLRRNASLEAIGMIGRLLVATVPLYASVVAVVGYSYTELSPWSVFLFFVPAVAAQRLLILYQEQRRLAEDLAVANNSLEHASLSFASALVSALDARDRYTAGHSAAVAIYARDIATRLGLPSDQQQLAHLCGLLHDIGKVGLPVGILEKTGALSLEERRTMEEHSVIGERILTNIDEYAEIARVVRHHHERVDGNGYPDRLVGDEIPVISRIIAVADAYNAMTSGRPYRAAMHSRVARLRLAQGVGTQFDTSVVAAFEAILATASDTYLVGARADFAIEAQRHSAHTVDVTAEAA